MQLQQLLEAMIAYMGGDARRIQHFINEAGKCFFCYK